ncbi:MAG: histidine kinase [Salibacteraceae bacterium]
MFISSININAQRHHFVSYSVKEGLAQSQVRDIIQARDGHLWIATIGGVSKFDGTNFTNFNKANGLLNNIVTAIYETSEEAILIACQGGVVKIKGSQINKYPFKPEFSELIVFDILEHNGKIWLATNGEGILQWADGVEDQIKSGSSDEDFVRTLAPMNSQMLAGSKAGLALINATEKEWVIKGSSINKVVVHNNEIWTATTKDGIYRFTDNDTLHLTDKNGLTSRFQKDICIDQSGTPWFITKNGIATYNAIDKTVESILAAKTSTVDNLKVVFSDNGNNIWLGTSGSGILKFTGTHTTIFGLSDGMASDQVMAIEEDENSNLWFATYGAGVLKYTSDGFKQFDFEDGINNNTVWSVENIGSEVWVGTSEGINIIANDQVSNFSLNDSLPFIRVSSIFQDSKEHVWIGTRDGILRVKDNEITTPSSLKRKAITEVKSFCELNGVVWMSSRSGLRGWDIEQNALITPKDSAINDIYISSLAQNGSIIWAGTDDGVYGYDIVSEESCRVDVSEKPSANIVNFLAIDPDQDLWIGTDNGLFSLNTNSLLENDSLIIRSYNEHDGITSRECNQNAAYRSKKGRMWFGLNGSLVSIRSTPEVNPIVGNSQIKLREFLINFEPINIEDYYNQEDGIVSFEYQKSRFTIRYSAIHFSNPEKVEYSYRLLGSDEDWSPAVKENSVTYANLSPGDYTFQTRIKLENTQWGAPVDLLKFKLRPPFYFTWWFMLVSALALLLITYLVSIQFKKQRKRKQAMIDIQNQAKILGLEQQTLNAHMNRHFIFNALNSIQYYINTQEKKLANSYLTQFASLVRKNLDSAQVQNISLKDEIDRLKLYMNLEQMRFKDRFDYTVNVAEDIDINHLYVPSMILQPFVENSIMHGILPAEKHGKIEILVESSSDSLKFDIIDNGIGIEKSVLQKPDSALHVSNGMKITRQRMEVLSSIHGKNYGVVGPEQIIGENGESMGTKVTILLPKIRKEG